MRTRKGNRTLSSTTATRMTMTLCILQQPLALVHLDCNPCNSEITNTLPNYHQARVTTKEGGHDDISRATIGHGNDSRGR